MRRRTEQIGQTVPLHRADRRRGIEGGIGDYLIVVRASNGQRYALQGVTRFDSGRLWIGNPVVPES